MNGTVVPALYIKRRDERPATAMLRLTTAAERVVVRLTGGCGHMAPDDAARLVGLFAAAFRGFRGGLLFGGTRMIDRMSRAVVPGITEAAPVIRSANPGCVALGVVPRTGELRITPDGMVLHDETSAPYVTIAHPDQDVCLLVQDGVDDASPWTAEYEECMRITDDLRTVAGWRSLLVAYNGGAITEAEIHATAARGWPVLLISGSGRTAGRLAEDTAFLEAHPCVGAAPATLPCLRRALIERGVIPDESRDR